MPADFATELVANLCSGGTLAFGDHPLGNIIEFHPACAGFPTIRSSLGTTSGMVSFLSIVIYEADRIRMIGPIISP